MRVTKATPAAWPALTTLARRGRDQQCYIIYYTQFINKYIYIIYMYIGACSSIIGAVMYISGDWRLCIAAAATAAQVIVIACIL